MSKEKLTAEEITLDFSEQFQNNYPKKPLWDMHEPLRKKIEQYADQKVNEAMRFCLTEYMGHRKKYYQWAWDDIVSDIKKKLK